MSLSVPQIKQQLEKAYNRREWQYMLHELFPQGNYNTDPDTITLPKNDLTKQAVELGNIDLDGGLQIGLFEIQLAPKVKLERNRVGLRTVLKQIMRQLPGALVVFVQGDKWRLSYVSQSLRKDENGQLVTTQTAPKRFTYLLGKGESALTAAQRFLHLHERATATLLQQASLYDFEEAFNVEKLSKEFFKGYKEHYEKFLAHILEQPAYRVVMFAADSKAVRDFVKKLLGRIVFLYFLQKKGWLAVPENKKWGDGDYNFMQNLFQRTKNKEQFYANILVELFFDTLNSGRPGYLAKNEITKVYGSNIQIPYLNGGLFENDNPHTDLISFPPKLFEDLFNFFGQYNFTVYEDSPDDHTVAVDPEMLGRIFESLLEEHRNKTGAFYTPKQVVHYMCRESLLEYLKTHSPEILENKLSVLINEHESNDITKQEAKHLDKLLKDVKICDPAIGSGAFPMGLLYEIFHARHALHPIINPHEDFEDADVKKEIIEGSIFGVDIESGAVDIAQLRFWLALVVDENEPRELPNLDYKIITGNSLISRFQGKPIHLNWHVSIKGAITDTSKDAELLQYKLHNSLLKLYNKQHQYFSYHGDKYKLQLEIRQLKIEILRAQVKLNRFDFEQKNTEQSKMTFNEPESQYGKEALRRNHIQERLYEFDQTIQQLDALEKNPSHKLDFFDWQLDFAYVTNSEVAGEESGFDIVIGNPPYVQLQKMDKKENLELQELGFETFTKAGDIYCLFYEVGISQLLKKNGILCYITSNSWLRTQYGERLRNFFTERANPLQLINLENTQMFQTAIVETSILIIQKSEWTHTLKAANLPPDYNTDVSLSAFLQPYWQTIPSLSNDGWIIGTSEELLLKKKMEESGKLLKDWNAKMNFGIKTGFNKAFIIPKSVRDKLIDSDKKNEEVLKPLLRGKDVQRFSTQFAEQFLINAHNGILIEKDFFNKISETSNDGIEYFQWNEILRPVIRKEDVSIKKWRINRVVLEEDYPSVYEYMQGYEKELKKREDQGAHWTNLRSCDYVYDFEKPKIIWGEISDNAKFAYDDKGYFVNDRCSIIVGDNLKYLLAFLNSRAIGWYFNQISTSSGMGTNMWKQYKMEEFPIPTPDQDAVEKIEYLVDFILYLKDASNEQLMTHTDNNRIAVTIEEVLNMIVFELYFKEHMVDKDIDVIRYIPVYQSHDNITFNILRFYNWLQTHENPVRNRIILADIVSKDVIVPIKQQTR